MDWLSEQSISLTNQNHHVVFQLNKNIILFMSYSRPFSSLFASFSTHLFRFSAILWKTEPLLAITNSLNSYNSHNNIFFLNRNGDNRGHKLRIFNNSVAHSLFFSAKLNCQDLRLWFFWDGHSLKMWEKKTNLFSSTIFELFFILVFLSQKNRPFHSSPWRWTQNQEE